MPGAPAGNAVTAISCIFSIKAVSPRSVGLIVASLQGCKQQVTDGPPPTPGNGNVKQTKYEFERSTSAPEETIELDGQTWTTSNPGPLGDPEAVKGGTLKTSVPNWPATLRIYGKASNTFLNSIVEGKPFRAAVVPAGRPASLPRCYRL